MKSLVIATSITALITANVALADNKGERHIESVDSGGNAVTADESRNTKTNLLGTTTTEQNSKVVTDPKGLGNKTTETRHSEVSVTKDGDTKSKVETVDRAGTKRVSEASREHSENWTNDGSTTTATRKETVDPRGLGNKHTVETKETVEHDAQGNVAQRTKEHSVDGNTTSKTVTQ